MKSVWQPIDTMPLDIPVLVYHVSRDLIEIKYRMQGVENMVFPGGASLLWYSHWSPLPEPPCDETP